MISCCGGIGSPGGRNYTTCTNSVAPVPPWNQLVVASEQLDLISFGDSYSTRMKRRTPEKPLLILAGPRYRNEQAPCLELACTLILDGVQA